MEHEIAHVAVEPPDRLEANLVEKVATILNKELYDTRLLLKGSLPKIVAHCHSAEETESITRRLKDMGLVAIAVRDSELHKTTKSFKVRTMEFSAGEVLFRDQGGMEKRIGTSDVFLIIKGIDQNYMEQEKTSTRTKLNLPLTALMGGIPVWRSVKEQTSHTDVESEWFASLYGIESPEPIAEIRQHHVDYSFLGTELLPSSFANFNTVVTKLPGVFRDAILDDRLTKPLRTGKPLTTFLDDLKSKSTLIYLCHLAVAGAAPSR